MMIVSRTELETRHRTLDLQIKKLDRRGMHMTPHEQLQAMELKKLRLATKDELFSFNALDAARAFERTA